MRARPSSSVEKEGGGCLAIAGDVGDPTSARRSKGVDRFGKLDMLVNNAAEQHPQDDIGEITPSSLSARSAPTSSAISS